MLDWITYSVISWTFVPACAAAGSHIGIGLAKKIWRAAVDRVRGVVTLVLKCNKTYIVHNGTVIEISRNRKYTISHGNISILDYHGDIPLSRMDGEADDWELI